jgi:hypothetical protein
MALTNVLPVGVDKSVTQIVLLCPVRSELLNLGFFSLVVCP